MIWRGPSLRRVLPAIVAAALVCVPFLPQEHVHRAGIEGRTDPLVHAHASEPETAAPPPCGTSLSVSHGEHAVAMFLSADCTAATGTVTVPPALAAAAIAIPLTLAPRRATRHDQAHPIHGPPGASSVPRAPPSFS